MRRFRLFALPLAAFLVLTAASLVLAQDDLTLLDGRLRTGQTVTIPGDETIEGNLYVFAGTIAINGTVEGDLTAFGGTIEVTGSIEGDVIVAGGQVRLFNAVGGDVRAAGGQLEAHNQIGGDLLAAGGQVTVYEGGDIAGDLIVSGGTLAMDGNVDGSIEGTAGTYARGGTVGGTENVRVNTTDEDEEEEPAEDAAEDVLDGVRHFVIAFLIGALLLWLLPRGIRASEGVLRERPFLALGGGFLAFLGYALGVIGLILAVVLLAILFGLLQLGALVGIEVVAGLLALMVGSFAFWLAVAYVADVVVALVLGRLVARGWSLGGWQELVVLAIGLLAVVIVTSLPFIGGIAKLVVVLFGLGALAVAAWRRWRGRGSPPPAADPAEPMTAAPVGG